MYDNVKGTEELLRLRHREREGWLIDYSQWDRSRLPKMPLVYIVVCEITWVRPLAGHEKYL